MYFDIGANIGLWTKANLERTDKIICVEASPITFQKLSNELSSNPKVECLNYAVCSSKNEFIEFYHSNEDTISTLNVEWLAHEKSRFNGTKYTPVQVKTISIDKLIEKYGKPEFIKIDVEGGEYMCLSSLTQKVDLLCFEWAAELKDIALECLIYAHENLGYNQFYVEVNKDDYNFRPTEFINLDTLIEFLNNTQPKYHFGMIWCK